jgi:hypothetical protein
MAITKIQSESMNLADTYAFTGTVTGAGGVMKPAFAATLASTQSVSNATETKVTFNTEIYDTDNCYDNSTNYRFTPTTAGKYFVYATVTVYSGAYSAYQYGINYIRKNGSTDIAVSNMDVRNGSNARWFAAPAHTTVDMNGSTDYIEVYGLAGSSSSPVFYGDNHFSTFGAYKIIE